MQTKIDCVLTIEEVEGGKCRQTLEGDVSIGIPGLGRIAERIICSSLRDVYTGIPEIVERCMHVLGRTSGSQCMYVYVATNRLTVIMAAADRRWNLFRDEVLKRPDGRDVLFNGRPPLQEDWVSQQVRQTPVPTACLRHIAAERVTSSSVQCAFHTLDAVTTYDWCIAQFPQVADVLRRPYGTPAGVPSTFQPAERTGSLVTAVAATAKPGLESAAALGASEAASTAVNSPASGDATHDVQDSAAEQRRQSMLTAGGGTSALQPPMQKSSPFAAVQGSSDRSPRVRCINHALCRVWLQG